MVAEKGAARTDFCFVVFGAWLRFEVGSGAGQRDFSRRVADSPSPAALAGAGRDWGPCFSCEIE